MPGLCLPFWLRVQECKAMSCLKDGAHLTLPTDQPRHPFSPFCASAVFPKPWSGDRRVLVRAETSTVTCSQLFMSVVLSAPADGSFSEQSCMSTDRVQKHKRVVLFISAACDPLTSYILVPNGIESFPSLLCLCC